MTTYNFRLSATNEKGQGPTSPSVSYTTLSDTPKPPSAPTAKERATPTSLYVEWQPPTDDGGSPVLSYVLQMDEGERKTAGSAQNSRGGDGSDDRPLSDVYTGPDTSYKAEGLKPGRKYRFQVTTLHNVHVHACMSVQCLCTVKHVYIRPKILWRRFKFGNLLIV